ncbi:MAG: HlyD family secretion protein [Candidatus Acidiferrales bacterium]
MRSLQQRTQQMWRRSVLHRALLVAPPVVLLLLAGFWQYGSRGAMQYYSAQVEKGDIVQVVQATGTINALTTVQVGSQVSGIVADLFADFNSKVKKNDVIAQIDPSILKTRLLQAEADLDNARANIKGLEAQIETQRADVQAAKAGVDRAQAQLTEAQLNLNRTEELFEQGIVSISQRDTVKATYDGLHAGLRVAEAQHDQAQARVKQMRAQLDQAKAQLAQRAAAGEMAKVDLGHTVIRAPIDGTVIARNVDVGQTVAASLQAPTLFIIAQDLTKMQVYAKTDESDVGKIRVGAMATFRVDSFPRDTFRGRVTQVRMNATTVQNVVTYDTIIEFDNPAQKLFPGMTAYVTIPVEWAREVVKIPNGALRFKPDFSPDELKAIYEKHGIQDPQARMQLARAAASGSGVEGGDQAGQSRDGSRAGGRGGQGGGGQGGGFRRGQGGGRGGPGGGGDGEGQRPRGMNSSQRQDHGVVWALDSSKNLVPIAVKIGVTDFTFTELKDGKIEPGAELVIGQSSGRAAQGNGTGSERGANRLMRRM